MQDKVSEGIVWGIISAFWISVMLCGVRYLLDDYNAFIIVFWRCVFGAVFMLPWLHRNGMQAIKTSKMPLYVIRAVTGIFAMILWFYGIGLMPLPQATALSFTAPIFSAIAAIFLLNEKSNLSRWMAIIIAFIGALIIIRPGFSEFSNSSYIVLLSTMLWALASVVIKKLSDTESPETITFYMTYMMAPLALPFAIIYWQEIELEAFLILIMIGLTSNLAHNSMSRAFSKADLSVILPFDFLRLIFISIFAYFLFGDQTNIYDIVGSLVIISSSIFIARKERKATKQATQSVENSL